MTTLSPELLTPFLDLPHVKIIEIKKTHDAILIYVSSTEEKIDCHSVEESIAHFHGFGQEIKLRHLPIFGYKVYIIMKPKRFLDESHPDKKTITQKLPWYREKAKATNAYENHILVSLINSTIEDVSCKEELGYGVIENIVDKNISSEINWDDIKALNCLGIDEISLKKGHKDFVTIVSAVVDKKVKVIALLKDRKKQTIKDFF